MPSLAEYYQAPDPSSVQAFELGDIGLQRSNAIAKAALGKGRLLRGFTDRTLPQLTSSEAAAGRFFSGGARRRSTWAGEDVQERQQDIDLQLNDVLGALDRRKFFTNLGI